MWTIVWNPVHFISTRQILHPTISVLALARRFCLLFKRGNQNSPHPFFLKILKFPVFSLPIMKTPTIRFVFLFFSTLLGCTVSQAAEQDNWYIAWEASVPSCRGVAYHVDQTSGVGQIYVTSTSSGDIKVYDLNGSLARTIIIASSRY